MVKKFRTMESVITRWVDCASVTLSLFKLFLSGEGREIRAVPVVQFNRYCTPWLMVLKWTRLRVIFKMENLAFCLKTLTPYPSSENKILKFILVTLV